MIRTRGTAAASCTAAERGAPKFFGGGADECPSAGQSSDSLLGVPPAFVVTWTVPRPLRACVSFSIDWS